MSIRAILTAIACIAGILGPTSARGELVNRWSFNNAAGSAPAGTVITDSISGSNGVVVGTGATFSGTALTIPGNTTGNQSPATIAAYVDLPNGLISSKSNLTVEIWATVVTTRNWQRLFDFGRMNIAGMGSGAAPGEIKPDATTAPGTTQSSDNLMLAVNRGTTPNTQRAAGRLDGATELNVDSGATIATGTEYHFAMVIEDGAGSSGPAGSQLRWYLNGSLIATRDLNFRITSIEDVNNWLGRSQWSGDSQANISFNEVRLYNHAMSASEIVASRNAGPNPGAPVASPDSVTMHHGQKARIPVTANDAGSLFPAGVTIVSPPTYGAASPDSAGRVLYAHTSGAPASDSFTYTVSGMGGTSAAVAVTVNFATGLRIANNTLNVPSTPPPTSYQLINPYPNLVFNQPLCIRTPPGETNRLFVCEKTGLVRVIPDLAAATPTAVTFLNLPALLSSRGETLATSSENGLLGLAFHPGYATNGYFYVFYSVTVSGSLYQRVSRFTVQAGNPNAANTASEVILINQVHPASNHNGGDLHFGPDGYLYISLGDGGGANDQYNNSQRIDLSFFSAMARIDVDKRPGNLAPNPHTAVPLYSGSAAYAVPVDNPFVGATTFNGSAVNPANVRTEFYAVGLRNPWRFSFDLVTSNLWCADVGQNLYEEIDLITSGGNYGWAYREGAHNGPKAASAPANFDTLYHTPPLYEYTHGSGSFQGFSVTGGLVYRGSRIPSLYGAYLFGDYVSGHLWALRHTNSTVNVERIAGEGGIVAFGTDPANGDVLLADLDGSRILRLVATTPAGGYPLNLSDTGVFADVSDLSPAPGVLPYTPNLPFWSDYAEKRRWFIIPDSISQMTWSRDGDWTFPTNQIWVKHFDLEMERGNPATKRRLETRLLVRNAGGVYGVSYQWNQAQTEATLAPDAGVDFDLVITNASQVHTQRWRIPSRAECLVCHTPQSGHALSFTTRQLNRTETIHGFHGNQLELLHAAGYFSNTPEPPNTLSRHVPASDTNALLETRVRSYLDVNCANCHRPGGTGGGNWDGRAFAALFSTGLINGDANNNGGDPANKLVVPRETLRSILLKRIAATNGFTRMPPLASSELDHASIALVADWIQSFDTNRMAFNDWQVQHFGSTNAPSGDADADPDADGRSNRLEYLVGSEPLLADTAADLSVHLAGSPHATVSFSLSPNATAQVQTSTNLIHWSLWDVPGNDGIPQIGNPHTVAGPATNREAYFRLILNER